eukprot:12664831-Ditylum_brightwellii.AAC.1
MPLLSNGLVQKKSQLQQQLHISSSASSTSSISKDDEEIVKSTSATSNIYLQTILQQHQNSTTPKKSPTATTKPPPLYLDEHYLRDWLSDILNNVRGCGEVLFVGNANDDDHIDVMKSSEAIETFLYRKRKKMTRMRMQQRLTKDVTVKKNKKYG